MNFLESPGRYVRTARTSRDVCRDSVAIERPMPARNPWPRPVRWLVVLVAGPGLWALLIWLLIWLVGG